MTHTIIKFSIVYDVTAGSKLINVLVRVITKFYILEGYFEQTFIFSTNIKFVDHYCFNDKSFCCFIRRGKNIKIIVQLSILVGDNEIN